MLGDYRSAKLSRRVIIPNEPPISNESNGPFERSLNVHYPSSSIRDLNARINNNSLSRSFRDPNYKNSTYKSRSMSGCNSDTEITNGPTNNATLIDSDSSSKLSINKWRVGGRRSLSSYSSGEENNYSSTNFPIYYDNTKDVLFDHPSNAGSRQNLNETLYYEPSQLSDQSYFSRTKAAYNNSAVQYPSNSRPEKPQTRLNPNNISTNSSTFTRKNVRKLRDRGSTFSIKDWELAQFSAKINVKEFRHVNTEHTDGLLGLISRRSTNSFISSAKVSGISGMLLIHLIAGVGLNSNHSVIKDLYCVIETDALRRARSMIRTSTECFEWDEVFEIEILNNTCLSILLYQWDPRFRHRLCFYGNLTLESVVINRRMYYANAEKVALQLEPKGILYFKIQFFSCEETFQRSLNKCLDTNSMFGVPLKDLIQSENSPIMIPILVQACVEEVNLRGLEVVGIYRLSGSIKLKIQLKEMFEHGNCRMNLSSEAVPDIHAVTSVLKDFLRELPEPLFTDAFYQMIINAHELHKTNSASGEKLMFNILDCLPVDNQNVLLFLIDHIKQIISKAAVNKMDEEALSNIFGPILFYPSVEIMTKLDKIILDPIVQSKVFRFILKIWPNDSTYFKSTRNKRDSSVHKSKRDTLKGNQKYYRRDPDINTLNHQNVIVPVEDQSLDKSKTFAKSRRSSKSRERLSRAHEVVVSTEYYDNRIRSGRSKSKSERGKDRQRSQSRGRSIHKKTHNNAPEVPSRQHSQSRDRNQSHTRVHPPYS